MSTNANDLVFPGPANRAASAGQIAAMRLLADKCGLDTAELDVFTEGPYVRLVGSRAGRTLATLPYRQVIQDGRPVVLQLLEDVERRSCLRCGRLALEPPLCQECRGSVQNTLEALSG